MYTFDGPAERRIADAARPRPRAGIVRAAIEHNLIYERRSAVWTMGRCFRHERPQRGRYRQFHQFDVEALGFAGPTSTPSRS
jgi:histidyl-tRNA synthetase